MALVMAEMKVEKITMADMITTTLKSRSISFFGVTCAQGARATFNCRMLQNVTQIICHNIGLCWVMCCDMM